MKTGIHRQAVSVLGRTIALIATVITVGHAATAAESSPADDSGPFYSSLGREFDANLNSFWRGSCLGQSAPGPKVELRVQPALPPGIEFLGVTHLGFRGLRHTVETRADGEVSIKCETTTPMEQ